jgi:hypothetical protein
MASGEFAERRRLFPTTCGYLLAAASDGDIQRRFRSLPMLLLISGVSAGGLRATAPGYDSSASGLHIHGWKTRTERFWCRTIGTSVLKQPDVNYCTGGISFSRELEQHNIFLIYGGAATALGMVSHNAFCLIR